MPWPSSAVNSGPRRLSPPPRITETRRNSQPMCSTAFCSSPADRPDLQSQVKNTGLYVAFVVSLHVVIGLGVALVVNMDLPLKWLFRVVAILPWTMPDVIGGIVWRFI